MQDPRASPQWKGIKKKRALGETASAPMRVPAPAAAAQDLEKELELCELKVGLKGVWEDAAEDLNTICGETREKWRMPRALLGICLLFLGFHSSSSGKQKYFILNLILFFYFYKKKLNYIKIKERIAAGQMHPEMLGYLKGIPWRTKITRLGQNADCLAHTDCVARFQITDLGREESEKREVVGGKEKKKCKLRPSCRIRMLVPLGLDCLHCSAFREQVSAARALTYLSTNLKRIISLFIVSF